MVSLGPDQFVFTFGDEAAFSDWISSSLLPQVIGITQPPLAVVHGMSRIGAMRLKQQRKSASASFGHAHPSGVRTSHVDRAFASNQRAEQFVIMPSLVSFVGHKVTDAGFSLELGNCSVIMCTQWWEEARARGWIDDETDVIVIEFTVFNAELSVASAVSWICCRCFTCACAHRRFVTLADISGYGFLTKWPRSSSLCSASDKDARMVLVQQLIISRGDWYLL